MMNDLYIIAPTGGGNALAHHGVKGMRWGVRHDKRSYRSTSVRSAIARRQNAKVDKGFQNWNEGAANRDRAIELGKKRNQIQIEHDKNPSKESKAALKSANKEFKQALKKNTAYRKGTVRSEVGSDLSRKYLSNAKKIEKALAKDPTNKALKKQYTDMMNKHDIERAKARKAQAVGVKRSNYIAGLRRKRTMAIKGAAIAGGAAAGAYALKKYGGVNINSQDFMTAANAGKTIMRAAGYFY